MFKTLEISKDDPDIVFKTVARALTCETSSVEPSRFQVTFKIPVPVARHLKNTVSPRSAVRLKGCSRKEPVSRQGWQNYSRMGQIKLSSFQNSTLLNNNNCMHPAMVQLSSKNIWDRILRNALPKPNHCMTEYSFHCLAKIAMAFWKCYGDIPPCSQS